MTNQSGRSAGGPLTAHRAAILHFLTDPGDASQDAFEYFEDGLLTLAHGDVVAVGPAMDLLRGLPLGTPIVNHRRKLLLPGFIDTHIHFPQTDVIGSGGHQLLDWLHDYTFPAEGRYADAEVARETSLFFLNELLNNGTTTAMVFCSVHKASVDAFFGAAEARGMRMIAGKVLMDRNCPEYLRDTAQSGERETRELITAWHGRQRLQYAITPRFAATSSEAQLASAGQLAREFPDTYIHSHVAENRDEIAWIRELFPHARSYLDVYDRFGLLRKRALYAHCIHLDATDRHRMAQTATCAAFCPTSNLYLGSGLFDMAATDAAKVQFALATDVGGGTSFSMLRTMGEAYKVAQLAGQRLSPLRAFYLATLGGSRCLDLEGRIGNFVAGTEGDFIVLDPEATPLLARRMAQSQSLVEKLLVLMTLGDERAVSSTYLKGVLAAGVESG